MRKSKYSEYEKLGAGVLCMAALVITGLAVAFGTWKIVIGISIFTMPALFGTFLMAASPRWNND